jgi:hypothetical protein
MSVFVGVHQRPNSFYLYQVSFFNERRHRRRISAVRFFGVMGASNWVIETSRGAGTIWGPEMHGSLETKP